MRFLIVSAAPLIRKQEHWYAYGPYVKEMAIWAKYTDSIHFCSPHWETDRGLLVSEIPFTVHHITKLGDFNLKTPIQAVKSIYMVFSNLILIFNAMRKADHIHLRCPGNVGLLGCLVQILFPHKTKTAKYAGNWDPKASQPLSYRIQKWILSNTFLTRNMKVLVYGEWEGSSSNIMPFFTASYKAEVLRDVENQVIRTPINGNAVRFLFVGTLSAGKRPEYALQLVERIIQLGYTAHLDFYGEGAERAVLEKYIQNKGLEHNIFLHGNQTPATIQQAYQTSHFVLLPSQSEGWPKVVAEAMFWGCVPIATKVSCVPYMLDFGNRGILLTLDFEEDVEHIVSVLNNKAECQQKSKLGEDWSRQYTLDFFEMEIVKLLKAGN